METMPSLQSQIRCGTWSDSSMGDSDRDTEKSALKKLDELKE